MKIKKTFLLLFKILILIGVLSFLIIQGLIVVNGREKAIEKVDYVIVLGARLYGDIPSPALLERLKVASEYLLENQDIKVVVAGGQGIDEYIPEAEAMKKYLMEKGIEEDRIIIEDKSTSTFENLLFSLDKIQEIDSKENLKVMVVTNKYHLFRAKFLAERLGMEAYGLPAEIPPSIVLSSYIREYLAVIKSIIFDRVR